MSSSSNPPIARINYLNAAAYVANVVIVYAVGAADTSRSNAAISAKYQTLVTPAGWAFAIWGIIFTLQLIWAVTQLFPSFRASPLVVDGVSWYYIAVCGAQIAWTICFSFELIVLSLVAMLAILFFLVKIVGSQYKLDGDVSIQDFFLLKLPFEIHCGWITAASIVNISLVLVKWNASATIQFIFAILSLIVVLLVNVFCLHLSRPIFVIPLVLAWASIAIAQELKQPQESILSTFSTTQISTIRIGAIVCATGILAATIGHAFKVISSRGRHETSQEGDDLPPQASDSLMSNKQ